MKKWNFFSAKINIWIQRCITFNSYVKASKYVGFHRHCVKRSCDKNIVYYSKKIDKKIMFKRVGGSVND